MQNTRSDIEERQAYLNGQFMPHSKVLEALNSSRSAGGGFYDVERTFGGRIYKLRRHLERLYTSLKHANFNIKLSVGELESITCKLLEINRAHIGPDDDYLVSQVVMGENSGSASSEDQLSTIVYCETIDFASFAAAYNTGVKVATPTTYVEPAIPGQKSMSSLSTRPFSLMTDAKGNLTECQRAGFMFVKSGRIKLPARKRVLPGISIETIEEITKKLGIPIDEGDFNTGDAYEADEAFVVATHFCILPVASINGLSIGEQKPGDITKRLLSAWSEEVGLDLVAQAERHLVSGGT